MQQIVLATSNRGKIKECKTYFTASGLDVALLDQQTLNITPAEETGQTYLENALLKARHACQQSKLPAIADDSGLCVPCLAGQPGIYSARFAGENATDDANMTKLLDCLEGVDSENRMACFYCVLVYLRHEQDPAPIVAQGRWSGSLLTEPQGNQGFGYDPIFWVASHQCSAAQLPLKTKNTISHRAQALQQLVDTLQHMGSMQLG